MAKRSVFFIFHTNLVANTLWYQKYLVSYSSISDPFLSLFMGAPLKHATGGSRQTTISVGSR